MSFLKFFVWNMYARFGKKLVFSVNQSSVLTPMLSNFINMFCHKNNNDKKYLKTIDAFSHQFDSITISQIKLNILIYSRSNKISSLNNINICSS